MQDKIFFNLPPRGALEPNDKGDPLDYYYRPLSGILYRRRIEQALSLLNPPYRSILEIGYGSGILLLTLANMAKEVYGVDIDSDPLRVARNLSKLGCHANLLKADILKAAYPEKSFDLIVAISVFEHIKDLEPVIEQVSYLLRDNGLLLVGMPRVDSFMRIAFSLIGYNKIENHHVTNYLHFLDAADNAFKLYKFSKMPILGPRFTSIYFNMLMRKR